MIISEDYNFFKEQYKNKSKDELIELLFNYTHQIVDLRDILSHIKYSRNVFYCGEEYELKLIEKLGNKFCFNCIKKEIK